MENNHTILLNVFVLLLVTMLPSTTTTTTTTTPTPPSQQLNNIIDALIGAGDFTNWVTILSSSNATRLPISATLFVPQDPTLHQPPLDPFLLPYHVIPHRLLFSDLRLFPLHARLPTLLPGKSITVTENSAVNFSLDGTLITHPDLFSTANLAVHGVKAFLDYSLFGDGIPPPPPSLPIGDAIGTDWKSSASCSQGTGVVLVFLLLCFGVLV